jgi:hypothetical protein
MTFWTHILVHFAADAGGMPCVSGSARTHVSRLFGHTRADLMVWMVASALPSRHQAILSHHFNAGDEAEASAAGSTTGTPQRSLQYDPTQRGHVESGWAWCSKTFRIRFW